MKRRHFCWSDRKEIRVAEFGLMAWSAAVGFYLSLSAFRSY